MKTGIGQSKYCIHQPFSRCLISLCCTLFDLIPFFSLFRLITSLFDPTLDYIDRSRFLQWLFFGGPKEMEPSIAENPGITDMCCSSSEIQLECLPHL